MFRLTFILCCGLFLAMLIGGQDRGQMRFGLLAAPALPPARPVAANDPGNAPVVQASFAPERPLITPPAEPTLPAIAPAVAPNPVAAAVPEPAVPAAAQPEAEVVLSADAPTADAPEVRYVNARSVNVRGGPSTGDAVLARLKRGEAVVIVEAGTGPDGWSRIRIEGDGVEGYVASRLLAEVAP